MDAMLLESPSTEAIITNDEVAHFEEQGFVLPKVGLPEADAVEMRAMIEQVIVDNPDWHGIVRMPHIPTREGQLEGIVGGEKIFRFALHPTIIAAARRLIGRNLILWGAEIFAKPAGVGARTPWHQDCYNPAVKAGEGRALPKSAMIWIAVDDVSPENGSLSFIPGIGREGRIEHKRFKLTVNDLLDFEANTDGVDMDTVYHSHMKSGHFSVHDLFAVHGANANTSGRRRVGLTFHYMAAEDAYDRSFGSASGTGRNVPAPLATRPIWLVLGENKDPCNDFVTGHQNLGDLDVLAEEARVRLTALYN